MKRRLLSAHHSLYLIIFVCWILPLLLVVLWFSTLQEDRTRLQTEEAVTTSVEYATSELSRRLSDSLTASRSATYDRIIHQAYSQYLQDGAPVTLYSETAAYLDTQYGVTAPCCCTGMCQSCQSWSPAVACKAEVKKPANSPPLVKVYC